MGVVLYLLLHAKTVNGHIVHSSFGGGQEWLMLGRGEEALKPLFSLFAAAVVFDFSIPLAVAVVVVVVAAAAADTSYPCWRLI